MGGSGIAGDVLPVVAGPFMPVPVVVHKGYGIPNFIDEHTPRVRGVVLGRHRGDRRGGDRGGRGRRPRRGRHAGAASSAAWPTTGARRTCRSPTASPCPGPASARSRIPPLVVLERIGPVPRRLGVDRRRRRPAAHAGATSWSPTATRPSTWPAASAGSCRSSTAGAGVGARGRRAVEDPVQRERQGAGVRQPAARALPQRDLRLGPERRRHPPGVPRGQPAPRLRAPAGHPALRAGRTSCSTRSWPRSTRCVAEGDGPLAQLLDLVLFGDFVSLHRAAQEGVDPGRCPCSTTSSRPRPTAGRRRPALPTRPAPDGAVRRSYTRRAGLT